MDPLGWVDPARAYVDKRIAITKALMGMVGDLATNSNGARQKVADAIVNAPKFQIPDQMDDAAMSFWNPAGLLGKIVWHGSPHSFTKFDASKIGTGEGAQAMGHGLYFADQKGIAQGYRDALSPGELRLANGGAYNPSDPAHFAAATLLEYGGDKDAAIRNLTAQIAQHKLVNADWSQQAAKDKEGVIKAIRSGNLPALEEISHGSLYKADLPDEWIPKMLDWDKPLSQQSDFVKSTPLVKKLLDEEAAYLARYPSGGLGERLGSNVMSNLGKSKEDAARLMREAGIPGIRYLDGGSRSAGQGSYNYVVFPGLEDQVKILERNGVPIK